MSDKDWWVQRFWMYWKWETVWNQSIIDQCHKNLSIEQILMRWDWDPDYFTPDQVFRMWLMRLNRSWRNRVFIYQEVRLCRLGDQVLLLRIDQVLEKNLSLLSSELHSRNNSMQDRLTMDKDRTPNKLYPLWRNPISFSETKQMN